MHHLTSKVNTFLKLRVDLMFDIWVVEVYFWGRFKSLSMGINKIEQAGLELQADKPNVAKRSKLDFLRHRSAYLLAGAMALGNASCGYPQEGNQKIVDVSEKPDVKDAEKSNIHPGLELTADGHVYFDIINFSGKQIGSVVVTGSHIGVDGTKKAKNIYRKFDLNKDNCGKMRITDEPITDGGTFCVVGNAYDTDGKLIGSLQVGRTLEFGNPRVVECPADVTNEMRDKVKEALD